MKRLARLGLTLALIGLLPVMPAPAGAAGAETGPALSEPADALRQSLVCPGDVTAAKTDVILLVPGTTVHPLTNFGWSWMKAFEALGMPYCYVITPDAGMSDIQVTSEHVVSAIREVHRLSGRKVDVVGHSQGGTNPRWALRWWPDTRTMIDDYVGFAPSAHGGQMVDHMCADGDCAPSIWQQRYQSKFVQATNSGGETFPGIDYTVAWTHYDQFLTPPESTTIAGATNINLQDLCPANTADHVSIGSYDPVGYAIMMDALTHPGPADPTRLDPAMCQQTLAPYVTPPPSRPTTPRPGAKS